MNFTRLTRVLGAVFLAAIGIACDNSPTRPNVPNANQSGSNSSTQPQLREVKVVGAPGNVHIGATAQVRAVALYSDGGYVDVTNQSTWRSSSDACRVSSNGVIAGISAGIADVTVDFGGMRSSAARVACGFLIVITTFDGPGASDPILGGVTGEVLSGPLAGLTFTTGIDGRAVLPPVAAAGFQIRFARDGFENYLHHVAELPRETTLPIPMARVLGTRLVFTSLCAPPMLDDWGTTAFRTRVESLVRVTSELLDPVASGARGWGTVRYSRTPSSFEYLRAPIDARVARVQTAQERLPAGEHQLERYLSDCGRGTSWRVTLEFVK